MVYLLAVGGVKLACKDPSFVQSLAFLQIRCGNFQNGLFRPQPTSSTSCQFKFKQLRALAPLTPHIMYLEKRSIFAIVQRMFHPFFFILHPLHTFLLFKTHVKKCKKKPIRIRTCRFLLTAKNDCRYTVFKIDLKKVYCTGP